MKKILTTALFVGTAALSGLALAPSANATPSQDTRYVACVAPYAFSYNGPSALAWLGRSYAADIASGYRTPAQEQAWVYATTPNSVSVAAANALVNCATSVWLGYGPDGTYASSVA